MFLKEVLASVLFLTTAAHGQDLESRVVEFADETKDDVVVLKNDSFTDEGGQAYLQLGFVTGEKAGIYVQVPTEYEYFYIDYFRVLIGSSHIKSGAGKHTPPISMLNTQAFFEMGVTSKVALGIPRSIENAVQLTPGPYWNDIPAQGLQGPLGCARGGELVGAALEFTHTGAPSVYRDLDGLASLEFNQLMAIPGGWNYSAAYGLRGDWVLRIVGREATAAECGFE